MAFLKQVAQPTDSESIQLIESLKDQVRRLKSQQNEEEDVNNSKAKKLQQLLDEAEIDRQTLVEKVRKLEMQKGRVEDLLKQSMKGGNMDLIDEVGILVRRIEFLEEQSDKRAKSTYLESQEPYVREI